MDEQPSRAGDPSERVRAERWRSALDSHIDPFAILEGVRDASGALVDLRYVEANRAAVAYHGIPAEQLIGRTMLHFYPGLADAGFLPRYLSTAETGAPVVLDNLPYFNEVHGERRWYDLRAVKCGDGIALTWRDCTDRHLESEALAESEEQFRLLVSNVYGVVVLFVGGSVRWISPSVDDLLGYSAESLTGSTTRDLWHPEDVDGAMALRDRAHAGLSGTDVLRIRHSRGSHLWVEVAVTPFRTRAGEDAVIVAMRDVTGKVTAQSALQHEIQFDALTGLAKRSLGLQRIDEILQARGHGRWALLCFGINGMTAINHAHTYVGGDHVLKAVAERLVAAAGAHDRVARIAGDEFVILLNEVLTDAHAAAAAERILAVARGPVSVGDGAVDVTGSIGIAIASGLDAEGLLRDATAAMRQATQRGRDRWEFLDGNVEARARAVLELETALRQAISIREIVPWFMPLVSMDTGEVQGYEALVRWLRHDGTVASPVEFLEVAERTGLIVALDSAIMSQALDAAIRRTDVTFSINISASSLASGRLAASIRSELDRTGVDPARLHLEVTETALLQVTDIVKDEMAAISAMGITWWVDDFGTGFSSISHLRDLPITGLKLDRSFTADLTLGDHQANRLAQGLIGLADGLGLETIAEGVETAEQARILTDQGWAYGQGWLYGKAAPLPA